MFYLSIYQFMYPWIPLPPIHFFLLWIVPLWHSYVSFHVYMGFIYLPRSRTAGLCGNFVAVPLTFPLAMYESSNFSTSFPTLVIFCFLSLCFLNCSPRSRCEVLSHLDLRLPRDRRRGAPSVCCCLSVSLLYSRHLPTREWRCWGALETDHICSLTVT